MDFLKTWATPIISLIIGVGFTLLILRGCQPKTIDTLPEHLVSGYKTDTVYVEVYLEPKPQEPQIPVAPKTVTLPKYVEVPVYYPVVERDTIYLTDTLGNTFRVNPLYLSYSIGAPKLLYGEFTENQMTLHLLDTSGRISMIDYPWQLKFYDYYFNDNSLNFHAKDATRQPGMSRGSNKIYSSSNVYLTYGLLTETPNISMDYSLNYRSVGIYGLTGLGYNLNTLNIEPTLNLGLRLKIK